jgi:hypothetical protein
VSYNFGEKSSSRRCRIKKAGTGQKRKISKVTIWQFFKSPLVKYFFRDQWSDHSPCLFPKDFLLSAAFYPRKQGPPAHPNKPVKSSKNRSERNKLGYRYRLLFRTRRLVDNYKNVRVLSSKVFLQK